MTDYSELVKALRYCLDGGTYKNCILCGYKKEHPNEYCLERIMTDSAAAIEELLPKRGKWELIDGAEPMRWGCSRCKYLSWETSNYCPRCGAKMEVKE